MALPGPPSDRLNWSDDWPIGVVTHFHDARRLLEIRVGRRALPPAPTTQARREGLRGTLIDMADRRLAAPEDTLPEGSPFLDAPESESPDRLPQEGHIIGDQHETQRQHPNAQDGQDRENAA